MLRAVGAAAGLALTIMSASTALASVHTVEFVVDSAGTSFPEGWRLWSGTEPPYDMADNPIITGSFTYEVPDDHKGNDSLYGAAILTLDYLTGSRTWQVSDLNPNSTGLYFTNGHLYTWVLYFGPFNALGGYNAVVSEEGTTFHCGGCVSWLNDGKVPERAESVVPEPATWALMILGLGGVGWMLRRQRVLSPI